MVTAVFVKEKIELESGSVLVFTGTGSSVLN